MINFYNENNINIPFFDKKKYCKWIKKTATSFNKKIGELNYFFVTDEQILEYNKKLLNHNYYTDIITLDASIDNILFGEAYISIERVKENAQKYSVDFLNELSRVIIHACLHLVGLKDKTEKERKKMRINENEALKFLF